MAKRNQILDIEENLHSLLEELEKIKSASEQVDSIISSSEEIRTSAENIVSKIGEVVQISSIVLNDIREAKIPENIQSMLDQQGSIQKEFHSQYQRSNNILRIILILLSVLLISNTIVVIRLFLH